MMERDSISAAAATPTGREGGCRLLLVEDDQATAVFAARYLKAAGYAIIGPVDTEEAALRAVVLDPPDLVLADIELAEGDDGVRLADTLYRRWRIPTLFVSGSPHEAERGRSVALGILGKPYEMRALLGSVSFFQAWLGGSRKGSVPVELRIFESAAPYRHPARGAPAPESGC